MSTGSGGKAVRDCPAFDRSGLIGEHRYGDLVKSAYRSFFSQMQREQCILRFSYEYAQARHMQLWFAPA